MVNISRVRSLIDTSQEDRALNKVYLRGDRVIRYLIALHVLIGIGLSAYYDTWAISVPAITLAAVMFYGTAVIFPAHFITRVMAGISLQMFVILHIYQMHGLAEMHFFFFTSTTVMVLYQDPKSILPGVVFLIAQHLSFALLHNKGWQVFFFEQDWISANKLFYHFTIAFAQAVICVLLAARLRKQTLADAQTRRNLVERNEEIQNSKEILGRELKRKSEELAEARELQLSIIPDNELILNGFEIQAQMETCQEVGGDYFDYKVLGNGHAVVAIGDATGHGMKAAIVVAAAKAVFQRLAGNQPLNVVFREISMALQGLGLRSTYMGLILMDLKPGKASFVASGMPPVLIKRAFTGKVERLTQPGPFIGFLAEQTDYPMADVRLLPGDILMAYSDGLSERFNARRAFLGWEAIRDILEKLDGPNLPSYLSKLINQTESWQGSSELTDDMTVVLARCTAVQKTPPPLAADKEESEESLLEQAKLA